MFFVAASTAEFVLNSVVVLLVDTVVVVLFLVDAVVAVLFLVDTVLVVVVLVDADVLVLVDAFFSKNIREYFLSSVTIGLLIL